MVSSLAKLSKAAPMAAYAIQGYAPRRDSEGALYSGRFFAKFDPRLSVQLNAAEKEWAARRDSDLAEYWPRSEIPDSYRATIKDVLKPGHWQTHWWTLFNPRQLLVHAQILKAIESVGTYEWSVREYVLGAFQQYLRNQCMSSFWNPQRDTPEPMFSNSDYRPKATVVENCVFAQLGRGNWRSSSEGIVEGHEWASQPWEAVGVEGLRRTWPALAESIGGKSARVFPNDPVVEAEISQGSATDLDMLKSDSIDLVVTDPPFGGILQYAELADFFYVWLRLLLHKKYSHFSPEFTPKSVEVVSNPFREKEGADEFYQRLLTQCWREAHRVLKPGGVLSFTFHHSEDDPWVSVLQSLFDAGFYLEATYPIRSDETKGDAAQFGAQQIEYDIIHVCRKRD
jgi:putative DNA methylase